jgi:acetyltransferase-like isoleucine patch superfamily enzyme
MFKLLEKIDDCLDQNFFRWIVKLFYPQYKRPRKGYVKHYQLLYHYFFMQKIVGINRSVPWPVDFRSSIHGWKNIKKGIICDPGDNPGIYIEAFGGLILGDNVNIGANSSILSSNHDKYDHRKIRETLGVKIGNNVWIGSNCVILPGTIIGDEVTIGAGCVINGNIPSRVTVTRSESNLQIRPKSLVYQWDIYSEKLT